MYLYKRFALKAYGFKKIKETAQNLTGECRIVYTLLRRKMWEFAFLGFYWAPWLSGQSWTSWPQGKHKITLMFV